MMIDETPSDSTTCPVRAMNRWLQYLRAAPNDPVFPSALDKKKPMTFASVSTAVKSIARHAKLLGYYSRQSLQIAGATAQMNGKFSTAVIRSIAGWESKTMLRYFHNLDVFNLHVSREMGF
jgi:hypothetical protein